MADLLIRGASKYGNIIVSHGEAFDAMSGEDYEVVVLPKHGRLIDADKLYEKTAEWEAQALCNVHTHSHNANTTEWRKWSTVLTERTAFKHDVADAVTVIEASEDGEQDG